MQSHEQFLRTICDAPDDNAPRLVYADWLEERGETARAEFIRVQCELAKPSECLTCGGKRWYEISDSESDDCIECSADLRARSAELLKRHGREWATAIMQPVFPEYAICIDGAMYDGDPHHGQMVASWQWQCGFPSVITLTCEQLMGRVCPHAEHAHAAHSLSQDFKDVRCNLCHGTGRLPPLGPAIAAVCPVRKWVLSDKQPQYFHLSGTETWEWYGHVSDPWDVVEPERQRYILPGELWKLLECAGDSIRSSEEGWKDYSTADAAQAALSDAVNAHVRPLARADRLLAAPAPVNTA